VTQEVPGSSGAIEEQGPAGGVFSSTQISERVSINSALDPSTLCYHDSDTCVLQKTRWVIEYDFDAEKMEKMMVAMGRGPNPEEGGGTEQKTPPSVMGQS